MNENTRMLWDWFYLEAMYFGALEYSLTHARGYAVAANRLRERMTKKANRIPPEDVPNIIEVPTEYSVK